MCKVKTRFKMAATSIASRFYELPKRSHQQNQEVRSWLEYSTLLLDYYKPLDVQHIDLAAS